MAKGTFREKPISRGRTHSLNRISAVAITALFFGQRMAKEYAGAAVLVPYFLLTLVAIYLLAPQ